MQWQEVCARYPAQWLVVEILSFREGAEQQRHADELAVLAQCPDTRAAYLRCKQLRYCHPGREFHSTHTATYAEWWPTYTFPVRRRPAPGEIEALYHDLRSDDDHLRRKAGHMLMHLDPPPMGWLLAALQDEDWRMRSSVASMLTDSGQPEAVEPLLALLSDPHPTLRWQVAQHLGLFEDPRALLPLLGCLRATDPPLRWCAAASLGKLRDRRAFEPLRRALQEEDAVMRGSAATALGTLGDRRAVLPLIARLRDDVVVRQQVAYALGELRDERAILPLLEHLQDQDYRVRYAIFKILSELGEQSVVAPLKEACQREPHSEVREFATDFIERLEARLRGQETFPSPTRPEQER